VTGVDERSFTLSDESGAPVPAFVDQIGGGAWALFPHAVFSRPGKTYTARLATGICDFHHNCTDREATCFTISADHDGGSGDTGLPEGFRLPASGR
jgi:hypothetical protein